MSKSKEIRNGEIEKDFEVIREEKKVFNCEICGQRFLHKSSLIKHVASVTDHCFWTGLSVSEGRYVA